VLELGPATGNQLPRFDFSKVTHVYGVESNVLFERELREKPEEFGISDKYTPIMCSIENKDLLENYGLVEESVDCVVSIQVLCSVGDVKTVSNDLYRLLKPGGEIILWEHQRSRDRVTCILQSKCFYPDPRYAILILIRLNRGVEFPLVLRIGRM
jgi:SAM-dependent methyltransferase